jgi:large conductance mechanosensitive channel
MRAATAMLRDLKEFLLRADLLGLAVAFLLALATFSLIEALVGSLISPAIAVIVGEPEIQFLRFTVDHTEFVYGVLIHATIVFTFVAAAIFLLSVLYVARQERRGMSAETRACPECASAISTRETVPPLHGSGAVCLSPGRT